MQFPLRTRVVGTHVENRLEKIKKYVTRTSRFILIREPDNIYDPNAIKVVLPVRKDQAHLELGYISAKYAAELAPMIDEGMDAEAKFCSMLVNPKSAETFGLIITVNVTLNQR